MPPLRVYFFSLCLLLFFCADGLYGAEKPDIAKMEAQLPEARGKDRIDLLLRISGSYLRANPDKALKYVREVLRLTEGRSIYAKKKIQALKMNALIYRQLGNYPEFLESALRMGESAKKAGNLAKYADALLTASSAYNYMGKFPASLDLLGQAKEIFTRLDDRKQLGITYFYYGNLYWKLDDYFRAQEYFLGALNYFEQADFSMGIANVYNHIGIISWEEKKLTRALEYYRKAEKIYENLGDLNGLGGLLNNIGIILREQGKYREALSCYNRSLEIAKSTKYQLGTAQTLLNIGTVYESMEDLSRALDYFSRALEIGEKINVPRHTAKTLNQIARIFRKTARLPEAYQHAARSLEIASTINIRKEKSDAYKELAEIQRLRGNYTEALAFYKKFKETNDSIFNAEDQEKVAETQTRIDLATREKEIALLKAQKKVQQAELKTERTLKYSVICITLTILLVLGVLFNRYRMTSRITGALKKEINRHLKTREKLIGSETKFRSLTEQAVVGFYVVQDNKLKYVNPHFLSKLGYTREEIKDHSLLDLIYQEDRPMITQKLRERSEGGSGVNIYRVRALNKEGDLLDIENHSIDFQYGGSPGILGTMVDITLHKKAREELLKSQKLEALAILAGGIAHDFNNLMTVLNGNVCMALDRLPMDSPARQRLEKAVKTVERFADLSQKLLIFTEGGWVFPKPVPLQDVLQTTFSLYPEYKRLFESISLATGLKPIHGDEHQLSRVFSNLFVHTREEDTRGQRVMLQAENTVPTEHTAPLLKSGDYIKISISNPGGRLLPKPGEATSTPFTKEDVPMTWNSPEMSAALCQAIIRNHNGHMSITQQAADTTRVEILLPTAG